MGIWGRSVVFFAAFVSLATVAYVYAAIKPELVDPAKAGGELAGPFSELVVWTEGVIGTILVVFLLAVGVWVVIGGAQEERNVQVRRRPRQ
jgi:flagellar biosynthesis component FlhA